MTPEQKIKSAIINAVIEQCDDGELQIEKITDENIDDLYDEYYEHLEDAVYEMREGQIETGLPCEHSRHYESKSVAAQASDGTWVGWTYWYGGGKHGCPEEIDWMNAAYNLDCKEEEKLVVVRTFSKKE